jgi:hypothetical protein
MVNWAEETYAALQEDAEGATPQGFLELRIRALEGQNEALKESLSDVKAQFALEDRGWTLIAGITAGTSRAPPGRPGSVARVATSRRFTATPLTRTPSSRPRPTRNSRRRGTRTATSFCR